MERTIKKNSNFKFSKIKKIIYHSSIDLGALSEAFFERIDNSDILNYHEELDSKYIYTIRTHLCPLFSSIIVKQKIKQQYKLNNEYILNDVLHFLKQINSYDNQTAFKNALKCLGRFT